MKMAQKSKFTDRQKKNIVKAYVECQNASAVARKYGCSETTIRRIVGKNPDVAEKVEEEKSKNLQSIREHMREQSGEVCSLLDKLIAYIGHEEKLEKANPKELATALGILIDKYGAAEPEKEAKDSGIVILPKIKERKC